MILNPKEALARDLFFQTGKTQKEIANIIGVSEKTIYLWMKDGDWKRLRSASKRMPSMIVENFYSQVQELNEEIRNRGAGKRYPTIQEAEVFRKMVMTIGRIQKGHTQPEYMEMMQKFLSWVMSQDLTLSKTLTPLANNFLKTRSVDGFLPFDIEFEPAPPKDELGTIDFHDASIQEIPPLTANSPAPSAGEDVPETTNVVSEQGDVQPSPAPQPNQEPEKTRNDSETSYDNTHAPSSETPLEKPEMQNQPEIGNAEAQQAEGKITYTYKTTEGETKILPEYGSKEYYEIPLYLRERLYTIIGTPKTDFTNGSANY